jgi:hypothetical protein
MKYLTIILFLFPLAAFAGPVWHCETMDRHQLIHIQMEGDRVKELHKHRLPVVDETQACRPVCKSLGCPETVQVCWTNDGISGKTKPGQRLMECDK